MAILPTMSAEASSTPPGNLLKGALRRARRLTPGAYQESKYAAGWGTAREIAPNCGLRLPASGLTSSAIGQTVYSRTTMSLHVKGLWHYPVKTLAGVPLQTAELTPTGIPGDRIVHVRGPEGVRTSRRHHLLLGLKGTIGPDGQPLVNDHPWQSEEALTLVRKAAGSDAWLEAGDDLERFDVLPLLVATDGAVATFGRDVRRLRPNILIGGVAGMDEVHWPGGELHIGDAVVRLDSLRGRCPMTTVDPDTLERDPEVLRDIGRRFGGRLALNAEVLRPGTIRVGDPARLVLEPRASRS